MWRLSRLANVDYCEEAGAGAAAAAAANNASPCRSRLTGFEPRHFRFRNEAWCVPRTFELSLLNLLLLAEPRESSYPWIVDAGLIAGLELGPHQKLPLGALITRLFPRQPLAPLVTALDPWKYAHVRGHPVQAVFRMPMPVEPAALKAFERLRSRADAAGPLYEGRCASHGLSPTTPAASPPSADEQPPEPTAAATAAAAAAADRQLFPVAFEFSTGLCVTRARSTKKARCTGETAEAGEENSSTLLEALVLRRAGDDHYELPKGHLEKGESLLEAALREVREETGLLNCLQVGEPLLSEIYSVKSADDRRIEKSVHYFHANLLPTICPKDFSCEPGATTERKPWSPDLCDRCCAALLERNKPAAGGAAAPLRGGPRMRLLEEGEQQEEHGEQHGEQQPSLEKRAVADGCCCRGFAYVKPSKEELQENLERHLNEQPHELSSSNFSKEEEEEEKAGGAAETDGSACAHCKGDSNRIRLAFFGPREAATVEVRWLAMSELRTVRWKSDTTARAAIRALRASTAAAFL